MNTIDNRKAYVVERLRERSRFPKDKHNPRRGRYYKTEWKYVVQDWEDSAVAVLWDRLEAAGLVRLVWRPDSDWYYEDLVEECFEIATFGKYPGGERERDARDRSFRDKIELDGVWGLVGEYRLLPCERCPPWNAEECDHPEWRHGDGVWGFIGTDNPGYELCVKEQTMDALKEDLRMRRSAR